MPRYGLIIDLDKCSGCYNCFMACRDEYCGNDYPPYSLAQPTSGQFWIQVKEKERGQYPKVKASYLPVMCVHCDNPPCVSSAADRAVYKREDGIVIIDPVRSRGQNDIVSSCPHRVIFWNSELQIPQKCTLCAHLLDQGWKEPRCVEACPTGAMVFGDMDDPNSEIGKAIAAGAVEELHPEYGLAPRVRYRGLPKRFVAGTVVFGDVDECGSRVQVKLRGQGLSAGTITNAFGDFEFERLEPGEYELELTHRDYETKKLSVAVADDVFLGELTLGRK